MCEFNFIAGKNPVGKSKIGHALISLVIVFPLFSGIFEAHAIDSVEGSIASVVAGFVATLSLLWLLADRLPLSPIEFLGDHSGPSNG